MSYLICRFYKKKILKKRNEQIGPSARNNSRIERFWVTQKVRKFVKFQQSEGYIYRTESSIDIKAILLRIDRPENNKKNFLKNLQAYRYRVCT